MTFAFVLLINIVRVYKWLILARVLVSWIRPDPRSRAVLFLHQTTEPILGLFRGLLPRTGMIDLSPLIAFIAMDFLQLGLVKLMIAA